MNFKEVKMKFREIMMTWTKEERNGCTQNILGAGLTELIMGWI